MTILTAIVAYILITIPLGVITGQALKANRRRHPALERKER